MSYDTVQTYPLRPFVAFGDINPQNLLVLERSAVAASGVTRSSMHGWKSAWWCDGW